MRTPPSNNLGVQPIRAYHRRQLFETNPTAGTRGEVKLAGNLAGASIAGSIRQSGFGKLGKGAPRSQEDTRLRAHARRGNAIDRRASSTAAARTSS